jgi:hypothetical protein
MRRQGSGRIPEPAGQTRISGPSWSRAGLILRAAFRLMLSMDLCHPPQCGAGFILPGEGGRNLPPAIEGAVVALVSDYWASRGRDPTLRAETMIERQFWVGAVGDPAMLPPRVLASIAPFRRPAVAVA